ncbi:SpoIID/LytB domain-containing protein [Paenibacillus sp. J31TS4]|uniref:SpoIID/LytB domain-containing protein n=1 Tax=Paenibacillus sp. J31TS4 TaxID=2807195 RepID=UPI001BCFCDD0|nr:SpoIID/LytB domain-containing protein [Paenibacillus sp. J31TS4]
MNVWITKRARRTVSAAAALAMLWSLALPVLPGGTGTARAESSGFTVVRQDGYPVAPGVQHQSLLLEGGGHTERVNRMEIDPSNPAIKLEVTSPKGRVVATDTVRNQAKLVDAENYRAVGAFNMDFYNTDPTYAGAPIGLQMTRGEIVTAPASSRSVLAIREDGTYFFEAAVAMTGTAASEGRGTAKLSGVNRPFTTGMTNHLVLYNDKFSATTKSQASGVVEVVVAPDGGSSAIRPGVPATGTVEAVNQGGNSAIPAGKWVLAASGAQADWARAQLTAGKKVTFDVQFDKGVGDAYQAVSGGVVMLKDGAATAEALADNDRHPRTFVASKAGKLYVYTFDGRQPSYSDGVTLREGAIYLQEQGMEAAINVDGGGSTTYAARQPGDQSLTVLNSPSDGYERSNSNSLVVVSTAPVTALHSLVPSPKGPFKIAAGSSVVFTAKGQDVSYNGVPVDPASLVWQATAGAGTMQPNGTFTASASPGSGQVTVASGTVTASVEVTVVDSVARLELSPTVAVVNPGQTQQFRVRGYDAGGGEIYLSSDKVVWSAEGGIGTIAADGKLTAAGTSASGKVIAAYNGVQAEASVNVGKPPVVIEDFEDLTDLSASSIVVVPGSVKLDLMSRPNPVRIGGKAVRLSYDFTGTSGTSAAYLNFSENGKAGRLMDGYPTKIGLWVYGDGQKHWLRGQIQDGKGGKTPIDFTASGGLNWTGWKHVTADIPSGLTLPLQVNQIYVVETSNANKNAGAVIFDELRSFYGTITEDLTGPVFSAMTPEPNSRIRETTPVIGAVVKDNVAVDASTIEMRLDNVPVAHQYDAATGQLRYTPAQPLAEGTHQVAIEALDTSGNPAQPLGRWSFTINSGSTAVALELSGLSEMTVGSTLQAEAVQVFADGTRAKVASGVQFASSDPAIAEVSPSGLVTAKKAGQATITAAYEGLTASYLLQVKPGFTSPVQEKVMAKNTAAGTIELELAGALKLADGVVVEQTDGGRTIQKTLADVHVGASNATFYPNAAGQVAKIVLNGETPSDRMRVGIRRDIGNIADETTFGHPSVGVQSARGFRVLDKKAGRSFDIAAGKLVTFTPSGGQIVVAEAGTELYRTANRLYAEQTSPDGSLLQISTIKRAQGIPSYRGSLELTLSETPGQLKVINDVTLEQYLYQVVPSEMPASFGKEALKAQAVAARTYALADYFSGRYAERGFHIDDSTASQVYNNSAENELTTQAVNETAGLIMKSGGQLVDARYYSTSGGYGASKHEVWSDANATTFPGTPLPYLTARSYTYDPADRNRMFEVDPHDEQALNAFYKTLSYTGYDSESLYFRWKVGLTRQELETTINKNLGDRYKSDPAFILTKQPDGSYASKPIPAEGIGTLLNLSVAKRGAGGNIMELVVEGTSGTYKIIKEYNIRFTIRPSSTYTGGGDILAYRAKGGSTTYDPAGTLKNPSILYSAFFTFDLAKDESGALTGVTFYGGGNGHGVGMSQYGASALGGEGWKFDQILNAYYSGMQLTSLAGQPYEIVALELGGLSSMKPGETQQAQVTARYNDGTSVVWTAGVSYASSNPAVASVTPGGKVTAVGFGEAEITAAYGPHVAVYRLQVGSDATALELGGLSPMAPGETRQAMVTAVYSDGTRKPVTQGIVFVSSDSQVAEVSADGAVRAIKPGQTVITAAWSGLTASYTLAVNAQSNGLELSGLEPMKPGESRQTVVSAVYADGSRVPVTDRSAFASSNPQVATVSETGLVQALAPGQTVITASWQGMTATYTLEVTAQPKVMTGLQLTGPGPMKAGDRRQLTATALYSDGSSQQVTSGVQYVSQNPLVASVGPNGQVTALSKGDAVIVASYNGFTANYEVKVTASVTKLQLEKLKPMWAGDTTQVKVTAEYSDGTKADVTSLATYVSSNPEAATVDATGKVTAVEKGSTTITASFGLRDDSEKLVVTKAPPGHNK